MMPLIKKKISQEGVGYCQVCGGKNPIEQLTDKELSFSRNFSKKEYIKVCPFCVDKELGIS